MKNILKRYLLTLLLCFVIVIDMPTMVVNAEEQTSENPNPNDVLEYVLESGDKEYLLKYQYLFPTPMVAELLKSIPEEDDLGYDPNNCLTQFSGTYQGPSGKETYYNLNMSGVVSIMRSLGYTEEEYPYWIREDGVKMFGDYVMVAAALNIRPKGTILETSLGDAIVVDTGTFAYSNQYQLDIAVDW